MAKYSCRYSVNNFKILIILRYSVLGALLFLIYTNYLSGGLTRMCKIFADGKSLFSKVIDKNNSNSQLNSDFGKIIKWVSNAKCLSTLI